MRAADRLQVFVDTIVSGDGPEQGCIAAVSGADGATVRACSGIARADDTGSIAGSTLTQDVALRRTVDAGVGLAEAVLALTATPAHAIGFGESLGALRSGFVGDAVLLDAELAVRGVWVGAPATR